MKTARGNAFKLLAAIAFLVPLIVAVWYSADRPSLIQATCKMGLPNYSRVPGIDQDELGCIPLSKRTKISGIITSDAFLASSDFEPFSDDHFDDLLGGYQSEFECIEESCAITLDKRDKFSQGDCQMTYGPWASVEMAGWVTQAELSLGHLGTINRRFYVDEVINISPAPKPIIDAKDEALKTVGYCQTDQ